MQAVITTDGSYILADIPYAKGTGPEMARRIAGAKPLYSEPENGAKGKFICWRYPLTMDTCHSFRRVFGEELRVLPALSRWARAEIQANSAIEQIKTGDVNARLVRVEREAPDLAKAIYARPYQVAGASFMAIRGQCVLGDEPGLGKTLQALAALVESDSKVILVTCPRTATRSVWERETLRWAPGIAVFVAQGSHSEREKQIEAFIDHDVSIEGCRKMLVINTEMVRSRKVEVCPAGNKPEDCLMEWDDKSHRHNFFPDHNWPLLHSIKWDAVIMDESHESLASTKNIQSKGITQVRYGAMKIRGNVKPGGLAIAMSGTPWRSKLPKAWGTLNWCRPDVYTSYWNFAKTHFKVVQGAHGIVVNDGSKAPEPLDPEAFRKSIAPYVLQRTKILAAPDLPPKQYMGTPPPGNPEGYVGIWLDMEPRQQKAYQGMNEIAEARVKGGTLKATGVLAEMTRLRQFACSYGRMEGSGFDQEFHPDLPSNKLDWIMEFLYQREELGSKVVIASSFTRVINLFASAIEGSMAVHTYRITGETPDRERARVVKNFNDPEDPVRVCLINTRAGGTAITLDQCCDDMIFVDMPWTSDEMTQAEDRIHRVSRVHKVNIWRLLSIGTVDEWMAENTDEQKAALLSARPDDMRSKMLEALS